MKVHVVHERGPDSACNGREVDHGEGNFDPGAGRDMDDYDEDKAGPVKAAPQFLKGLIHGLWDEHRDSFKRWSSG